MLWNAKGGAAVLGDTEMQYVSFGRGKRTLIVLPGLSDGLATVKGKALLLVKPYVPFLDRYTVYMFSRKDDMPDGYTIRDMARDQAAAMEALGIETYSVLGVSQGGMIAQYLAIDCPERVEKLVLAVTAPWANDTVQSCVTRWIDLAKQGDHRSLMIDTAEKSYSPAHLAKYRKLYPVLGAVGRPADYRRFFINCSAILGFDARDELRKITCPVLILGGGEDKTVCPHAAQELHEQIPHSEVHVYPDLGHAAYEEAKDFYARVFAFLDGDANG